MPQSPSKPVPSARTLSSTSIRFSLLLAGVIYSPPPRTATSNRIQDNGEDNGQVDDSGDEHHHGLVHLALHQHTSSSPSSRT
ncbi:hypothetical protein RB213_001165 [Colletotrichum asianum]